MDSHDLHFRRRPPSLNSTPTHHKPRDMLHNTPHATVSSTTQPEVLLSLTITYHKLIHKGTYQACVCTVILEAKKSCYVLLLSLKPYISLKQLVVILADGATIVDIGLDNHTTAHVAGDSSTAWQSTHEPSRRR
jgi:hypothetical protein